MTDRQPLLRQESEEQPTIQHLRQAVDNNIRDSIIDIAEARQSPHEVVEAVQKARSTPRRSPSAGQQPGAATPNFISAVIPLFGLIAAATLSAYTLGRWYFSVLWILFIVYGVWEVLRRRVARFEAYHRNRIDREIAKEKLEYHMETCEWINHIVDRFWAVIEPFVSSQVIDQANQELARQCPGFLSGLALTEFTLGSTAPHILGARVYPQTGSDVIHLDMDLCFVPNEIVEHDFLPKGRGPSRWNSKFVLTARVGMGPMGVDIPVLLREILFYGRMRAQIQLAANVPFVQRVEVGFLEPPKIDFVLKPLKSVDIMDLPGLSRFLHSIINMNVAKQLVDPNKITIEVAELLKGKKKTRMNSIGVLRVKVLQMRGLKDVEGSTVRVSIAGRLKAETTLLEKDSEGWNEVHYILIPSLSYPVNFNAVGSSAGLMYSSNELLGSCQVSVDEVAHSDDSQAFANAWKAMSTRHSTKTPPELNVGVEYFPAEYMDHEDEEMTADPAKAKERPKPEGKDLPPKYKSGILQITLHGAKDLPRHPGKKDWTTFVESSISNCLADDAARRHVPDPLNPYNFRSTTKKSNSPSWEETFEFLVVDYERDEIVLRLRDAKEDHPLGNLAMRAAQLLDTSNWFDLLGVESGKVYLTTLFKPIDIIIEDPSGLRYAPSIGVLALNIQKGIDFKKRNDLQGRQEYYLDLSYNGRPVRKSCTVKTMENPVWDETLYTFIKSDADVVSLRLYEENNLLKDSGEGQLRVDLRQLMAVPCSTRLFAQPLKAHSKMTAEEIKAAEKLQFEAVYYPIGTLRLSEANPAMSMVRNGEIEEPSNSGILELRTVTVRGIADKSAARMKLSCSISLSSSPADAHTTKPVKPQGELNGFTWNLFQELLVKDYSRTSLWVVVSDESGLMGDAAVTSISVPVAALKTDTAFPIPGMPAITVALDGQYRGIAAQLPAIVDNSGTLRLDIIRASVIAVDSGGTSDPFVTVKMNGKTVFKTKVIKKTVTPEWKEPVELKVEDRTNCKLLFEVSDWNQVIMSQPLGKYELDLSAIQPDKECPVEGKLTGVPTGTLWLSLFFETIAGNSAAGKITTVPLAGKDKSEGLVGAATDMTKGAAGAVTGAAGVVTGVTGSVADHTVDATKAVAHGAASAVKSVGNVFGLASSTAPSAAAGSRLEKDLKVTVHGMSTNQEIQPFDCAISVLLDGKERLYRTKLIKQSRTPDWRESFAVTAKQLKHARALEFVPESSLSSEALGLAPSDRPVFRLDLGRPELTADEGATFTLFLNDREDDPPLTLKIAVQPAEPAAHHSAGIGKMFGKVKFK